MDSSAKRIQCKKCKELNPSTASFCSECGNSLRGLKGNLNAVKRRIMYQTRDKIDEIRNNLDTEIKGYLAELDKNKQLKIGGFDIPDKSRETIRNALINFQQKVGKTDDIQERQEFKQWIDALPERLENETCLVCFGSWKNSTENILICPKCQSGGHQTHLIDWVKSHRSCPLCRQPIRSTDLLLVKL